MSRWKSMFRKRPWHMLIFAPYWQLRFFFLYAFSHWVPGIVRWIYSIPKPKHHEVPRSKEILVLSYWAYPYQSKFGVQRIEKFMKYLSRWGWKFTLITTQANEASTQELDPTLKAESADRLYTPTREITLGGIHLAVPDDFLGWAGQALKQVSRAVKKRDFALVLSTAPPYTNAVLGVLCAKILNLPLITDFRDPWTKMDMGWQLEKIPGLRALSACFEKSVLKASTRVLMADSVDDFSDFFTADDPSLKSKAVTIPNGFDEEDFRGIQVQRVGSEKNSFNISYVGRIYNDDSFRNIIAVFRRWQEKFPQDMTKTIFHYAGPSGGFFDQEPTLPFTLKNHGFTSHQQAIQIRMNSQLQIFEQPPHFKPHIHSGKIYEMIRTGTPIAAFVKPEGRASQLLKENGTGIFVDASDPETSVVRLRPLLEAWQKGNPTPIQISEQIHLYTREHAARKLEKVFEEIRR